MTKKKNYCQKCTVRHCAPTSKKCTRLEEELQKVSESEVGTVPNGDGFQTPPQVGSKKLVIEDHPSRAVEKRVEAVEGSVREMGAMMKKVLEASTKQDKKDELTFIHHK